MKLCVSNLRMIRNPVIFAICCSVKKKKNSRFLPLFLLLRENKEGKVYTLL